MRGYQDLDAYKVAYELAMDIFRASRAFPSTERFSLTDQILRASRSVAANLAEGYRKGRYPKMFISKVADADAEAAETRVLLDFALDCGYISPAAHADLQDRYSRLGQMLGGMMRGAESFVPRPK